MAEYPKKMEIFGFTVSGDVLWGAVGLLGISVAGMIGWFFRGMSLKKELREAELERREHAIRMGEMIQRLDERFDRLESAQVERIQITFEGMMPIIQEALANSFKRLQEVQREESDDDGGQNVN